MLRNHCCNHTTGRGNVNLVESRNTIGRCPISSSADFQNGQLFLQDYQKGKFLRYPFQLSIQHSRGHKGQEDECEVPHWVPTRFWRIEAPQPFQGHDKPLGPHREMPSMVVWCSMMATTYIFKVDGDLTLPNSPCRKASILRIEQYIGSNQWSEHLLQNSFHLRVYKPHVPLTIAFRSASRSQSSVADSVQGARSTETSECLMVEMFPTIWDSDPRVEDAARVL